MILKKASINSGYIWYLLKPLKVIENKVILNKEMKEQDKQRNDRITNRLTFSAVFKRSKYILDFLQIFEMKNK